MHRQWALHKKMVLLIDYVALQQQMLCRYPSLGVRDPRPGLFGRVENLRGELTGSQGVAEFCPQEGVGGVAGDLV
jgi:hypothetical protein